MTKIESIQQILDVKVDNVWGRESQDALNSLINDRSGKHNVIATSFADPKDIEAFKVCKAEGKTDEECFKVGDNGLGCWGDDTTLPIAMCALPPEQIITKFGSLNAGKHALVRVEANGRMIICVLADRMPSESNITNSAGIDLNFTAVTALGFEPPLKTSATWSWA